MNRLIICTILLMISNAALAETLYRWVEPDGSITFSPTPPATGVEYKAVDAAKGGAAIVAQPAAASSAQSSILATSEHDLNRPKARVIDTDIRANAAPAAAKQRLSYAPNTGSMPLNQITAATNETQAPQRATSRGQTVASSNKQRQCQDLSKRVLSLERRLRSPLEAQDMDNTVIAMARYQKSYDQYCVN